MPPPSKSLSSDADGPASNNLWIGNLSYEVTDSDLMALFEKHGPVDSITNYSTRSYAFVYYKKIEDAKSAKEKLQGTILHGNPIKIEFAKPARPCKSLWVAGISQSVSKEELEEEFMRFGKIQEFKFLRDRNTAYVDYFRLEDASQALKSMNGKRIGGDQIRVDFLRSQPSRREQLPDFRDAREGQFPNRGIGPPDAQWLAQDSMRVYSEPVHSGSKRHQFQSQGGRRGDGQPSKVLWINYPPSVQIEEDMLHNAMILFGEIERIKTFEDRNYAFVQFRSVDEARLAKEGLQGKLFSDPRITIEYSNSELAPNKDQLGNYTGARGPRSDTYLNEVPFRGQIDITGHNTAILPPRGGRGPDVLLRPLGPQGNLELQGGHHTNLGGPNWRRSSPAPGLLSSPSASLNPPNRSTSGAWDIFDASQLQREAKRSRVDGTLQAYDSSFPPRIADDRGLGLDEPYHVLGDAGTAGSLSNFEGRNRLSPVDGQVSASGLGKRLSELDYVWRGIIAKGGSPICRARCVPIGEGLMFDIPEVVNCTARTGLDMLTKHYADSIGFSIAYFLPDSEADFASYTEFLRYLGARNRAGVAKFDDGTTLFLVPPSDFLTNVLKVSGPERLYGVVLEFPQTAPASSAVLPPSRQPQFIDTQRQTSSQTGYNGMRQEEIASEMDYNRIVSENMKPSLKMLGSSSSSTPPVNTAAVSQAGVSLTPELIATLASLLPANKLSGSESSSVQLASSTLGPATNINPAPDKGLAQLWSHERQVSYQTGHLVQQFGSQFHNQGQFIPQVQAYPPVSNPLNLPSQGIVGYNQIPDHGFNLQQQGAALSRSMTTATPSQGHVSALSPVDQQHQVGMPHDPLKGHGIAQGTDTLGLYGSSVFQRPANLVTSANEVNGSNVLQPHAPMPQTTGTDVKNLVQERQSAMQGASQEISETEDEKNRRYQSTLLFAANLLNRVQHQPGTQTGQGSGNH